DKVRHTTPPASFQHGQFIVARAPRQAAIHGEVIDPGAALAKGRGEQLPAAVGANDADGAAGNAGEARFAEEVFAGESRLRTDVDRAPRRRYRRAGRGPDGSEGDPVGEQVQTVAHGVHAHEHGNI